MRLGRRLRDLPAPDSSAARERTVALARARVRIAARLATLPAPTGGAARERTVAAARERVAGRRRAVRGFPEARLAAAVALVVALGACAAATAPGRAVASWVAERLGLAEIGGPPSLADRRQPLPSARAAVVATGRAPDGERWEVVLDTAARPVDPIPGTRFAVCLRLEWPDLPNGDSGPGSCGPRFPPDGTGLRRPGVFARAYGHTTAYVDASAWPVLQGFARPEVARVRVRHPDRVGGMRVAPTRLARLTGALRRRVGAAEPVGYFVAFLAPSMPQYMNESPETRRALDRRAIEIVAYDARGRELGRTYASNETFEWTSP